MLLDEATNALDHLTEVNLMENLLKNFGLDDYHFEVFENKDKNYHPTRSILIKSKVQI